MREITAENAAQYLSEMGQIPAAAAVRVRELSGGVSNIVLRVDRAATPPVVLKQSRARLRVRMEWFSRLERIWTEQAALELLGQIAPPDSVPTIVFADPENYLFTMSCAPDDAVVWKSRLMAGEIDLSIGRQVGELVGTIHHATPGHPALSGRLADTSLFEELRIDPYYRTIARVYPDLRPRLDALISSMTHADRCLVLGDFSPKNILVHSHGLMLVDFETAHAGDPAFDLGFFLSHLLLKSFRAGPRCGAYLELAQTFWDHYQASHLGRAKSRAAASADQGVSTREVEHRIGARSARGGQHAAACMIARVDGKSPVDYLQDLDVDSIRRLGRSILLTDQPVDIPMLIERVGRAIAGGE